ncbi:MAG: hypothetical protein RSD27_09670 [Ruthenibacterium sp.]
MIASHDRSGWIGASDTCFVMGSWTTASFARWWACKLGLLKIDFCTPAMRAGTAYEHRILDALSIKKRDRQIRRRWLRLRVNLDGEDATFIHEVKTHSGTFRVSKPYWMQCQAEMYAAKKACEIVAYKLLPEDYENYFNPIELARISRHPIAYDAEWIKAEYLPRLRILARALRRKEYPHELAG